MMRPPSVPCSGVEQWTRRITTLSVSLMLTVLPPPHRNAAAGPAGKSDFFAITKSIDLLGEVYKEVSQNYVDAVNTSEFMYSGIDGMLSQLDPYTSFLDEAQSDELDEMTTGRYAGIGITISIFAGEMYVTSVFEGQAADKAGLQVGDRIVAVNGAKVNSRSTEEVRKSIKGSAGSTVTLSVKKDGEGSVIRYTLIREEVRVTTVPYVGMFGSSGYVKLSSFGEHTAQELATAIRGLLKQAEHEHISMNGIVIDLRGNPGGLLTAAVDVASLFVQKGSRIVSTRGRSEQSEQVYTTRIDPLVPSLPLVVIIDRDSASASEIFSGAVQELDRGIIVGESSFGKGLVQTVLPLPYDHVLKLTTAKYYTPSGRLIQKPHVRPKGNRKVLLNGDSCDSTKVYYTLNRRTVYGGGGIRPDVAVRGKSPSEYLDALEKEGLFFRFASQYHLKHSQYDPSELSLKPLFSEFTNFVRKAGFSFRSKPQQDIDSLKAHFRREGDSVDQELSDRMAALEKSFAVWMQNRMASDSTRIAHAVRREIIRHYDQREAMRNVVADDPVTTKAFWLLADPKSYPALLRP
jgi:carboxyl-terminal processing protease